MIKEYTEFVLNNIYLRFLLTLVITLFVAYIHKLGLKRVLKPMAGKTKTKIDDLIIKSLSSVIFYVILAVGFKIGFLRFEFESELFLNIIDTVLVAIVAILILRIISNFAQHWKQEWAAKTESTADDRLIPLVEKILKAIVIIIAVIFVFDVWHVNISPLLTTAGIAGIAISLAVKDSLANILGGLQLVVDKTFKVGDKVSLDSGELGVVMDIGLRSTKLRTYDNELVYIPNGQLANARVKNYTVPDQSLRVNIPFGVEYGSDTEQVRSVVLQAIQRIELVQELPEPAVQFIKMGDFALDFMVRVWINDYTQAYTTQLLVTDAVYNALNQAGIGIPFPTHTIYMQKFNEEK